MLTKSSPGCVGSLLSTPCKAFQCLREWRRGSAWASLSSPSRSGPRCPTRPRSWSEAASRPILRRGWPLTKWSRPSGFRWVAHFILARSTLTDTGLLQQCNTVPQTPLQTSSILKEQTEEEKEGLNLALKEVREGLGHRNNFVLKNPKLDSNSALAKRRKSKNSSSNASSLNSSPCDVRSIQEN